MSDPPLPSSFDSENPEYNETGLQKISRRLREEPLVPLGCLLTCWALYNATKSMKAGDHHKTQRMFRARIMAQGFTIVAMVAGSVYWKEDRQKRKEFEGLVDEKKAKEKQAAWIRELEARDEEDKQMREAIRKRREKTAKGDPRTGETTSAILQAVEETKATAEKAVGEQQNNQGILGSMGSMLWGKK